MTVQRCRKDSRVESYIKFGVRANVTLDLIPLTRTTQPVFRTNLEGQFLVNGQPAFPINVDTLPTANC